MTLPARLVRGADVKGLGSYLSPTFSSRLLSSSKTDLFERRDLTISDGCDRNSSRSSILANRAFLFPPTAALFPLSLPVSFAGAGKLFPTTLEEPDHFSYFSSRARIRCSRSIEGLQGEGRGDSSESEGLSLGPGESGVSTTALPTSRESPLTPTTAPPLKGGDLSKLAPLGEVEAARGDRWARTCCANLGNGRERGTL